MTTEQNRIYLDQQFFASLMKADVTSLSQLLADDFTLVDVMSGSEVDKPAFLTVVGSGQRQIRDALNRPSNSSVFMPRPS